MNIFIFEDEFAIATSLEYHLKSLGYPHVRIANNLEKAYSLIQEQVPDIAILDIRTPHDPEAGIKVAKYLNARSSIPLIFMTANDDELLLEKALGAKPDGYLSKTFNERVVLYSIERAIENLARRKEAAVQTGETGIAYVFNTDDYLLLQPRRGIYDKVYIPDILYVHAEGGVIRIVTEKAHYNYASTLTVFLAQVDRSAFIKVGRNFIVNVFHFEAFLEENYIQVKDKKIQLSQSEYKTLFNLFEVFRTKHFK
jgi:DNA-binding LytR/AlgR family response regulator